MNEMLAINTRISRLLSKVSRISGFGLESRIMGVDILTELFFHF